MFNVYITGIACFDKYARAATLITDRLRIALTLITDCSYWNLAFLNKMYEMYAVHQSWQFIPFNRVLVKINFNANFFFFAKKHLQFLSSTILVKNYLKKEKKKDAKKHKPHSSKNQITSKQFFDCFRWVARHWNMYVLTKWIQIVSQRTEYTGYRLAQCYNATKACGSGIWWCEP